jgi:hypothetical protein
MGNARKMRIYVDMTDVKTQDLNIQTLHSCPLHGSSFGESGIVVKNPLPA